MDTSEVQDRNLDCIGKHLDRNQILIGKEFWEEILEDGVSYNDFILAYQEAYKKAKVEETVIG